MIKIVLTLLCLIIPITFSGVALSGGHTDEDLTKSRVLPSTLITEITDEVEELREGYGYDEDLTETRELPSTLITDEEEYSNAMKKVEELREGYMYDEDLTE